MVKYINIKIEVIMKKWDYLIISIVGLIILVFFIVFYLPYRNIDLENAKVMIMINNQIIEELDLDENKEYDYVIKASKNSDILIYKNESLLKTITNTKNIEIDNNFMIKGYEIKMTNANCKHHDCMHMVINNQSTLPIVCTNGIIIKVINNSDIDIIV